MTTPSTIRFKKNKTTLHVSYQPNNDSWRYLLLLFVLICLAPIAAEAITTNSTFLYAVTALGVLLSVYVILNREVYSISLRIPELHHDPYRNEPTAPPLLFVGRAGILSPHGAILTHFDVQPNPPDKTDGISEPLFSLFAHYNNQETILLLKNIRTREESNAMCNELNQTLHPNKE